MIRITLVDAGGNVLAQASHDHEALLCFDREYIPGDTIVIETGKPCHLWLRLPQLWGGLSLLWFELQLGFPASKLRPMWRVR